MTPANRRILRRLRKSRRLAGQKVSLTDLKLANARTNFVHAYSDCRFRHNSYIWAPIGPLCECWRATWMVWRRLHHRAVIARSRLRYLPLRTTVVRNHQRPHRWPR